ncbi:hypothetical protein Tco_0875707, partial [Tanacetum coccineum]
MSIPATTEEKKNKKNNVKARGLLLMALPNEHQLTFSQYPDAKSMFAAIETRFRGNAATKKTQKTLLKQHLPPEWNTHVVVWMNKPEVETMSIDDLYNNFKIVEQKLDAASPNVTAAIHNLYSRDASKENSDDSLVKGQVSEDTSSFVESSLNVDKETVFLDKKIEFVKPKNHEKPVKKSVRNMTPREVLLKTALTLLNTVRPVNTAHLKPTVHSAKSMLHFSKQAYSTAQRPFYKQTALTSRYVNTAMRHYHTERPRASNTARLYIESVNVVRAKRVNAVKTSACWVWRPTKPNGKLLMDDKGFVDSGCSRHMTGNIAYLSDFKEFDGGYVTFGGEAHGGRISGKGTLKTDSLDFED